MQGQRGFAWGWDNRGKFLCDGVERKGLGTPAYSIARALLWLKLE